jgi:hypothetical protein
MWAQPIKNFKIPLLHPLSLSSFALLHLRRHPRRPRPHRRLRLRHCGQQPLHRARARASSAPAAASAGVFCNRRSESAHGGALRTPPRASVRASFAPVAESTGVSELGPRRREHARGASFAPTASVAASSDAAGLLPAASCCPCCYWRWCCQARFEGLDVDRWWCRDVPACRGAAGRAKAPQLILSGVSGAGDRVAAGLPTWDCE